MFAAIVRNSSESVGDSATICWNCPITLRTSASTPDVDSCVDVLQRLDFGHHERLGLDVAHQPHPLHALGEHKPALVGHAHNLVHRGQRSNVVQISRLGRVQAGVQLRGHHDGPLLAQRLDQLDGAFAANRKRQNSMGKQNGIPNRQNGNTAHAGGFSGGFVGGRFDG